MAGGVFLYDPTTSKALGVAANPLSASGNAAQAALGIGPQYSPYGSTSVSVEPSTLFFDAFDSLDTTNKWTAAGTVPPTATNGILTASLAATANATSTLISKPTFAPSIGFTAFGQQVTLETAQQTNPNNYRFWGLGQVTSFAYATPVTDGAGFEVDGTGALNCVVWVGGVRYVINSTNPALITAQGSLPAGGTTSTYGQTITWQGAPRLYVILFRPDGIFFYIGSLAIPVGVAANVIPNVNTLPYRMASINNSAGQLSTTFQASALGVGDSSSQNNTISDPVFQWRRMSVTPAGAAIVSQVPYPGNAAGTIATPLQGSSGNVAAAAATVTFSAVASQTNYLSGFDITGAGATGASVILATITGLLGGTRTYALAIPAGVTTGVTPLAVEFNPPLQASAANIAIVVSAPSFGAGNTNAVVNAQGYLL